MNENVIRLLFVSNDESDAMHAEEFLSKFEGARFELAWENAAEKALAHIEKGIAVDVIVSEDALPDISGVELARRYRDRQSDIPVIFLTASKDVNYAVEVMRLGVKDCLLKEDVASRILPQSILRVVEKQRLKREFSKLEIKKKRLEAMQEIVVEVSGRVKEPLDEMKRIVDSLGQGSHSEKAAMYIKLIRDNVERMHQKLEKLRDLKEDKTVKYIRDVKMIDLS
jgi:two-component system response regulator YesN